MVKELEANSQRNILRPTITKWRQLLVSHHQYNDISQGVFQQNLLAASLKKWTRLLWKQKANQHLVIEVREKYSKRNVRRMIIHWRQQVKSESLQAEHQEDNGSRHEYGTTQRAILWSDYGDENDVADWVQGFDSASTVTAVPGYLATPSKKPSLARAMATLSTTTPNVPLPTPFERHLRAQLSMYARTPGRKLFSDISESDKNVEE
jgi:protein SFI1